MQPGDVLVLGAGPAGMACAYELARHGIPARVVERNREVGGLCRTLSYEGFLFDIGGHRFLSKLPEVNALWKDMLDGDLLQVPRKSRIFYRGRFFGYPLALAETLRSLGLAESLRCLASCLRGRFSEVDETTLEGWMVKRFGRRLFESFFKTYTEKVWGMPCREISSTWAAQRIEGLSLGQAIRKALFPRSNGSIRTLSRSFYYPRLGPGLFYQRLQQASEKHGATFLLETELESMGRDGRGISHVALRTRRAIETLAAPRHVFSSIPLPHLLRKLDPPPPREILEAAHSLRFRSFIVAYLIYEAEHLFPDQWVYIHAPEYRVGRVQNYKNWSPAMVPVAGMTSLGMEYFVTEGDDLWMKSDDAMLALARDEAERLGLAPQACYRKGFVFRVPNAYPVYGPGYTQALAVIRDFLRGIPNLDLLGRAGLFRYNNSDHALLTGLYGARNLLGEKHDLWSLDVDGYDN
jgi:protoporphyrinogen oxidase